MNSVLYRQILLLTATILLCFDSLSSRAGHIYGGDISYSWVSGNTYTVQLVMYGDCQGANLPNLYINTPEVQVFNGDDLYQTLTLELTGTPEEVTPVCPDELDNTACSNPFSTIPGVIQFIYTANVTLSGPSADWRFFFNGVLGGIFIAGRSASITNITGGDNVMALEATLNNMDGPNNSAVLTTVATPFFCINVPANLNPAAVDADGDELSFALVPGLMQTPPGGTVTYVAPYTATDPLNTAVGAFAFSALTGQISFTPDAVQRSLVVYKVEEFKDGTLVGSSMREMTFVVLASCDNNPPGAVITDPSGGTLADTTTLHVCSGTGIYNFNLDPADLDGDNILMESTGLPAGATLTITDNNTPSPHGVFEWDISGVPNGTYNFFVTYTDNGCPLSSKQTQAYTIIIDGITVSTIADATICEGASIPLTTTSSTTGATFTWTPAAGLSDPTVASPDAAPTVTTTYIVTADLAASGCDPGRDTVTITIVPPPDVILGVDRTICLGGSLTMPAIVTPAGTPYTYSWTPATGLSGTTILNPVFTPTGVSDAGIDFVLMAATTVPGCEDRDTIRVRVLPNDINFFNGDTAFCENGFVNVNATGHSDFTYVWSPSAGVSNPLIPNPTITPFADGTYTLTASYPGCPDIVKSIDINIDPIPVVTLDPDTRTVCQYDTLQLHAYVNPEFAEYTYAWSPDSNLSASDIPHVIFTGMADATLQLIVTTPGGCADTATMDITVYPGDFALVENDEVGICPGETAQLNVTGGVSYNWTPGIYLSDSTASDPIVDPIESVQYSVLVTSADGCYDTLGVNVIMGTSAVLSLPDTVLLWPGDTYLFNPEGNCVYFEWFPPLGLSNHLIANPVAQPDVNTRYYVNARTELGCSTMDSVDVLVQPESIIDVPNAFVPGTGLTKEIKVVHSGIASLGYFRIYNRWGEKIFETKDINEGWNGQLDGTPQPMGVYVYQVEAITNLGRRVYKQGNITLIR